MARPLIDASSTLAWLFREPADPEPLARLLVHGTWSVPWLWRLEIVHAVTKHERSGRVSVADGTRLLHAAESLRTTVLPEPAERTLLSLATLSRPHQLSAYDAVYLDLALRHQLPLLSHDRNLREAAQRTGVPLVDVPAG